MKIENVSVGTNARKNSKMEEFIDAIVKLKPGQSFVFPVYPLPNNYRLALAVAGRLTDKQFAAVRDGDKTRICTAEGMMAK